jgi:hypothetical protein
MDVYWPLASQKHVQIVAEDTKRLFVVAVVIPPNPGFPIHQDEPRAVRMPGGHFIGMMPPGAGRHDPTQNRPDKIVGPVGVIA